MAEISNPHDRFFREVFFYPEAAQDFVRYYLPPEVAATMDVPKLELSRESFFDPNLQEYISDLLYHVRLRDGSPAYIYVLLEHKSFPDWRTLFQLLGYFVRIQERSLRETRGMTPVIPLVVYHGRSYWPVDYRMASLYTGPEELRRYWPDFAYHLVDLSRYSDDEIVGAAPVPGRSRPGLRQAVARNLPPAARFDPDAKRVRISACGSALHFPEQRRGDRRPVSRCPTRSLFG